MKVSPYLFMLVVASATGSWLFAAEPAPKQADGAEQKTAAAPAASGGDADAKKTEQKAAAADEKGDADKTPADKAGADKGGKGSPQRFIPSEQVRADFDVSFPVDI